MVSLLPREDASNSFLKHGASGCLVYQFGYLMKVQSWAHICVCIYIIEQNKLYI